MAIILAIKNLILSVIFLSACFTWPASAEENTTTEKQAPVNEAIAKPVPQPPLIDTQPQPGYEPEIIDNNSDEKNNQEVKPPVTATPQPPLIDSQPLPSYGPKDIDSSAEKENIKPISETVVTTPQAPGMDQTAEPAHETKIPDATTEDPVDAEVEQDEISTEETEVIAEQKQQAKNWTETYPISVNADWLQLKSGEWLRGRITIMQKDSLEFDSDELDDLVIKWKNVKYLKSHEPYSLRFDSLGRLSTTGVIEVIADKVHVKTDYDDQIFDRSDLQTIASGKETEISYWKSKVTFSINIRKGNTDQTDFTSKMTAKRRTTDSRLVLDYLGNFTQVEENETINNHRFNETYDYFLSRDLFWTPVFSEFFRDPFQNIERRINIGIGVGYSIINTNISEWDISAGPAYQETTFVSVQPGVDRVDSTLTMALGTNFNTELNSKIDIEGLYSIRLGDEETGNYAHHALLTIETELTNKLDFDVTAVWDRVRSPVADQDGNTPEQDDFRVMIGLGYDL